MKILIMGTGGVVRAKLPLYENEVRGTDSLIRMGEALFA